MTLPAQQYLTMRAVLRGALSANYPGVANPSDGEVLSFFNQLFTDSAGAAALSTPKQNAMAAACRSILTGNSPANSNPNDADVITFFGQVQTDASGAAALNADRYSKLKTVLADALSNNMPGATNPSQSDLLSYFGSFAVLQPLAVFATGQSQVGNQGIGLPSGWVSNPNIQLIWASSNLTTVQGPATLDLQNDTTTTGGAYEFGITSTLAASFPGKQILYGKYWANSSNAGPFCRIKGQSQWVTAAQAFEAFCKQALANGVTEITILHDQGSNEALLVQAAQTPLYAANLHSFLNSLEEVAHAFGLTVFFVIIQQNINFTGKSGIDSGQLATVRAAEASEVAGRLNAVLHNDDDINQGNGYHYITSQYFTIGQRLGAIIATHFAGAQKALRTPTTALDIDAEGAANSAARLYRDYDSRFVGGVTVGNPVSVWPDNSGNSRPTSAGTTNPKVVASVVNGIQGVQFNNGVTTDFCTEGGTLPAPGTTNVFMWDILRQDVYQNGHRLWGSASLGPCLIQSTSVVGDVMAFNGSLSVSTPFTIGPALRVQTFFSNSATAHVETNNGFTGGDFIKVAENNIGNAINLGSQVMGVTTLGTGNGLPSNVTWVRRTVWLGQPNQRQLDMFAGITIATYGSACGVT